MSHAAQKSPSRVLTPGQRVRCVTARLAPLLAEGGVYTVSRYWPPGSPLSAHALATVAETGDARWFAARFAPLDDGPIGEEL